MTFRTIKNYKDIDKAMNEIDFQQAKFIFLCYSFKYFFLKENIKE